MKFAILGCGSIGQRHLQNLVALKQTDLLAFDPSAQQRQQCANIPGITICETLDEVWHNRPNAVLITAPTHLHLDLASEAAQHGCHLFIEKPLANHLQGLDQLLQAVSQKKLITLVGCNMRFHIGLMKVKWLIDQGAVGQVISARVEAGQYLPDWRPDQDYRQNYSAQKNMGGGVILDAIHEIDYIRWLLGEVDSVSCFAAKISQLEIDVEDTAALLLRFKSKAIGEVHVDYIQRTYSRTCHIIGEEGTIRWDETAGEVCWYAASKKHWETYPDPPGWDYTQIYLDEMRHFLDCLQGQASPALDVFGGKRVLEIALAAKESSHTGQAIKLDTLT